MRSIGFGFLVAGLLLVGGDADAAQPLVFQADGAAIHGYDPVAYFTKSKRSGASPLLVCRKPAAAATSITSALSFAFPRRNGIRCVTKRGSLR